MRCRAGTTLLTEWYNLSKQLLCTLHAFCRLCSQRDTVLDKNPSIRAFCTVTAAPLGTTGFVGQEGGIGKGWGGIWGCVDGVSMSSQSTLDHAMHRCHKAVDCCTDTCKYNSYWAEHLASCVLESHAARYVVASKKFIEPLPHPMSRPPSFPPLQTHRWGQQQILKHM